MEYSKYSRRKRHWNNKRGSEEVSKNIETKSVNKNNHGKQETTLPMEVQLMMQKNQEAIKELKHRQTLCALCGEPIVELSAALADKKTDAPVHFDCVMAEIKKTESLNENEKIVTLLITFLKAFGSKCGHSLLGRRSRPGHVCRTTETGLSH